MFFVRCSKIVVYCILYKYTVWIWIYAHTYTLHTYTMTTIKVKKNPKMLQCSLFWIKGKKEKEVAPLYRVAFQWLKEGSAYRKDNRRARPVLWTCRLKLSKVASEKSNNLLWSFGECLYWNQYIFATEYWESKSPVHFCNLQWKLSLSTVQSQSTLLVSFIAQLQLQLQRIHNTPDFWLRWFLLAPGGLTKLHVLFMSQTDNYLVEIWLDEMIVNLSCPVRQTT